MGLVRVPEKNDQWSDNPLYHNNVISSIMSRNMYKLITSALNLEDTNIESESMETGEVEGVEGLYSVPQISEVVSYFSRKFSNAYMPEKDLSLNESMVPFKGKSNMKFYIPKKPVKWGVQAPLLV
eukprot:TRINITY_DN114302_c0_g1_i1.p1 TRINITY_DN114302_c0_g1~~TRINITY_DN114302_c0_g1_i1.p1  ORF type:complete len:137 (-),score=5.42 TRINITY_DN114302_c0_g1_i1:126-500(-)